MQKKKTKGNLFQEEKDKKRQYHCDYHKNLSENQKKGEQNMEAIVI